MILFKLFILLFNFINLYMCESDVTNNKVSEKCDQYMGEKFPSKFLTADEEPPTHADLKKYLNALNKTVSNFASGPNDTDINKAISCYFTIAILERTFHDDGNKLPKDLKDLILHIIKMATYYLSHFIYWCNWWQRRNDRNDVFNEVAQLMRESDDFSRSMPDFTKNQLQPFILTKEKINDYIEDMDGATLPREKYLERLFYSTSDAYHIHIKESDRCLARVMHTLGPSPSDFKLKRCHPDQRCKKAVHSSPSIAYGLSHRLLNMIMYRYHRRCYFVTPHDDEAHINSLCAFMYRECVYLAKLGYFARDMFLEHVALCGMAGYEEFYRRHWFHKAISWMDDDGCIHESRNYLMNTTHIARVAKELPRERRKSIGRLRKDLKSKCHDHPMAVLVTFLSNAVRHAAHFYKS